MKPPRTRGAQDLQSIERIANRLIREEPALLAAEDVWPGVKQSMGGGPSLFIGDQIGTALFTPRTVGFLDHRFTLLAQPGDVVVVRKRNSEFESYLTEYLGIRSVQILEANAQDLATVAQQCREDPKIFQHLRNVLSGSGSLTLHAYLVDGHLWRLAEALTAAENLPVYIAGPTPRLSQRVNDKLWFWATVREIVGQNAVPPTVFAFGPAAAAGQVARLAKSSDQVVVKVPDSAGSLGNIRLDCERVRQLSTAAIHDQLEQRLRVAGWSGGYPVLVGVWESDVQSSPSVQMWLPKKEKGPPEILGIFEQRVKGDTGKFVGAGYAQFSDEIETKLRRSAIRIGEVFQRIGYFGPCSFDCVLRRLPGGPDEIHWIECNGRWSGVSIPLAAAGKLLGKRPEGIVVVQEQFEDVAPFTVKQLRECLDDTLFRQQISSDGIVLIAPPRLQNASLNAMAVADSQERAEELANVAFERVAAMVT